MIEAEELAAGSDHRRGVHGGGTAEGPEGEVLQGKGEHKVTSLFMLKRFTTEALKARGSRSGARGRLKSKN